MPHRTPGSHHGAPPDSWIWSTAVFVGMNAEVKVSVTPACAWDREHACMAMTLCAAVWWPCAPDSCVVVAARLGRFQRAPVKRGGRFHHCQGLCGSVAPRKLDRKRRVFRYCVGSVLIIFNSGAVIASGSNNKVVKAGTPIAICGVACEVEAPSLLHVQPRPRF